MSQCNVHTLHPCPTSPEDGMANLAMAILAGLAADLEGPSPKRRQEARAAVAAHVPEFWMQLLDLSDEQHARVLTLLAELATAPASCGPACRRARRPARPVACRGLG
jgi:hypothetical protein